MLPQLSLVCAPVLQMETDAIGAVEQLDGVLKAT